MAFSKKDILEKCKKYQESMYKVRINSREVFCSDTMHNRDLMDIVSAALENYTDEETPRNNIVNLFLTDN